MLRIRIKKEDNDVTELFKERASPIDGSQRKGVTDAFVMEGKGESCIFNLFLIDVFLNPIICYSSQFMILKLNKRLSM